MKRGAYTIKRKENNQEEDNNQEEAQRLGRKWREDVHPDKRGQEWDMTKRRDIHHKRYTLK